MGAVEAFLLAAGLVFVAELGDKTQLLILAASLRGRALPVLLGAVAAFLLLTAVAVAVGAALGDALPSAWIAVAGGLLFIVLGVRALREAGEAEGAGDDGEGGVPPVPRRVGARAAFTLVLVGELGDKTQLATLGLAARGDPVATGLGAGLALAASAGLAVVAGSWLQAHLRPRVVALVSGWLFVALGVAAVVLGLLAL